MHIEINSGGLGGSIAIAEYQLNMSAFISDVDRVISSFTTIRSSTYSLSGGVGLLSDAVNDISLRIQTEVQKKNDAIAIQKKSNDFFDLAVRVDKQVSAIVDQNKDEFYRVNPWSKPSCTIDGGDYWYENTWKWLCCIGEEISDGAKTAWNYIGDTATKLWTSAVDFYQEHKKAIVTVLVLAAAIAVIILVPGGGFFAAIALGAAWGAISGAVIGGVSGGLQSRANGNSFWDGVEEGAFSGALSGAVTGAVFAGLGYGGKAIGYGIKALSPIGRMINTISNVTKAISIGMSSFDTLALADLAIDPSNNAFYDINNQLHSSTFYNIAQTAMSALAIFTGGLSSTMQVTLDSVETEILFDDNIVLKQDKLSSETYYSKGSHYDEFSEFWENGEKGYSYTKIENPKVEYVNAGDIEGVFLNESEVRNPSVFWNKRYSKTEYLKYVSDGGINNNPVKVTKVNDSFYYFNGDGRHRILAAQEQNIDIPVKVVGLYTK